MLVFLEVIEKHKNKSKFEQLYNTYKQTMFYVAYNILKDTYLAEDTVHESFLRIINNLDKIGEVHCLKTKNFIMVITKHIAIDTYRKRAKKNAISFNEIEFSIGEIVTTSKDNFFEQEVYSQVSMAIACLPINYSSVLQLKYSQGFSDKEIAKILLISEDNVRQRIVRAKKKLKISLKEMEND